VTHLFDPTDARPIHFLGIGGAGMSALALAARRRGIAVSGCDPDDSAFADLRAAGATVHHGHDPSHVAGARAVVVTAAARADHPELLAARHAGIDVIPRKVALAELVNAHTVVALSGTHGKTTTTVMTTLALRAAGLSPSGLAGGRVATWGGNAWLDSDDLWVVEADEYDQAFLTLRPTIAVINNVEADHLECYGSLAAMEDAFVQFARDARCVLVGNADQGSDRVAAKLGKHVIRFGVDGHADLHVTLHGADAAGSRAELVWPDGHKVALRLAVPGVHNLRNATAALGVVRELGGDLESAAAALSEFHGVGRRFERLGSANGIEFVDDYAHHPTELAATLEAARQAYPGRRIVAVFQPHLYSRTKEHAGAMGTALTLADVAIVTDVYAAREQPMSGVTGALVADAARAAGARMVEYVPERDALEAAIRSRMIEGDVVITLGAGDVTRAGRHLQAMAAS
jgi:UDP-N-acetylmuramate--alanine ligase